MAIESLQKTAEAAESTEAKDTVKKAERPRETSAKAEEAKETMVYIGPSLPGGKLKSNKIFIGTKQEIEGELSGIIEEYPMIRHLVVPISQLADKKAKVKISGNILHKYCADLLSIAAKKERMG